MEGGREGGRRGVDSETESKEREAFEENKHCENKTAHVSVEDCVDGEEDQHSRSQRFWTGLMFALSSVGMILVNKAAVKQIPHDGCWLLLQNSATIAVVWTFHPQVGASISRAESGCLVQCCLRSTCILPCRV